MSEGIVFRRAEASDLAAIVGLRLDFERITLDSGSLDEGARRAEVSALLGPDLEAGSLRGWIAAAGGSAVAQAALRLRGRAGRAAGWEGESADGELLNVYTDPAYRGRGIASALVDLAIAEALSLGLRWLILQPTEDSRRIYERAGFEAAGGKMVLNFYSGQLIHQPHIGVLY